MKIWIDGDYKCHISNDGTMREIETTFFEGKCKRFIEGYRLIPAGETWTRSDGMIFQGEMISPWKDYSVLNGYQESYEEARVEVKAEMDELQAVNADQAAALTAIYSGVSE